MKQTIALLVGVGLSIASGCADRTEQSGGVTLHIDTWSADHIAGTASSGAAVLAFESTTRGDELLRVTYDFGDVQIEYGASLTEGTFWFDGRDGALAADELELLNGLEPMLAGRMSADPSARGPAENLLGSSTAHLASASPAYRLSRKDVAIAATGLPDGVAGLISNSTADDGVSCVKKDRDYTIEFKWPNPDGSTYTYKGTKHTGTSCGGKGYCGDCFFTTGTWTLDCMEHDYCLNKAQSLGYPANDANPYDYWCGDEWQEAADDFTLAWAFGCRG